MPTTPPPRQVRDTRTEEAVVKEYEFWRERVTGDIWAVELVEGKVVAVAGPLHHDDVDEDFLPGFDYAPERADWVEAHRDAFDLYSFMRA